MENKGCNPEKVMLLKESNHLLADVLYADGVDIYKRSSDEMKEYTPTIVNTRRRIDAVLKEHFQTSFQELDSLLPKELQKIRESFLGYYHGSVEKAEKLKKVVPLNQLVGYIEVLVASAYLQLNIEMDADIEKNIPTDSTKSIPTEHLRMKILNAFKKLNQGKKWEEVQQEVESYFKSTGLEYSEELFEKWCTTFEAINHPLQKLYAEHIETMQINDLIYDLQFREQKRSAVIQGLVGKVRRSWKPADLEHDIHSQSAEANRSIIELTCNAIDANAEGENKVEVSINESGYSIRDHGSGMNPYVILEKLIIPKVSGKTGKETIGRFGVGFYTVLSHLKRKNDIVRIETHDGQTGHVIEFKIHERTGDVFVHTERDDKLEKGTSITVQAEEFDSQDAQRLCRELLAYNDRSNIVLNGEKMNDVEGFESVKGEHTGVMYTTEIADKSKASIMVNGVVIEHFNISGMNMCKEVAIDFPLTCSLPESRSELCIDQIAIASVKEIIGTVLSTQIDEQQKIAISNALYPVLEKLQARTRSNKRDDNLLVYFQEAFKDSVKMEGKVFLPNTKAFQMLDIPDAVYLDSRIHETDLEKIQGLSRCDQFESTAGYQLFIADFKEGMDEFMVEDEKILVIDRKIYERHKDMPAVLNVYFSNLDVTGQSKKEKAKGRITSGQKTLKVDAIKSREGVELDERLKIIFGVIHASKMSDFNHDDFKDFVSLNEEEQTSLIKQKLIERCNQCLSEQVSKGHRDKSFDGEFDKGMLAYNLMRSEKGKSITEEDKIRLMAEIKSMARSVSIIDLDVKIEDFLKKEIDFDRKIDVSELSLYRWLRFFDQFDQAGGIKLFALHDKASSLMYERSSSQGRGISQDFFKGAFFNNLIILNDSIPLDDVEVFFSDYDEKYLVAYCDFISHFTASNVYRLNPFDKQYGTLATGITNERLVRADEIFRKIFINKSAEDIFSISEEIGIAKIQRYEDGSGRVNFDKIKYQNVSRSSRAYLMYILEGGEILNEKGFDETNIEQSQYQAQIPLSTLVQAKKDNEQFFQGFSGTPAELVTHARESQRGVDPSKALRDIMHSAENQIVNEGYLWIREVLQNSLDAIKQNRSQFAETPKVSVDAYLRNKTKKMPEDQLWGVLQSSIKRFYPGHLDFFKNAITKSIPTLTSENFVSAIDALGAITTRDKEKFFPESLIQELKTQFETMTFTEPDLVVEARDPVGMDLHTVINYLLIPNESSKTYDEETVGKFGQGFFTIFGDAKEVLIKTSKGNLRTEYIKIKPIKDQASKIVDFSVEMSCKVEEFKGTVIQKVIDTDMPQVEAAFCKSAVVSYGGLIDRGAVQLDFIDQEINTPRTVLAETQIPQLGAMRIYDANENAMTQNGLLIKELDEELLAMIPENLKKVMQKNGIVLDIPASIKLIKSRADIAGKQVIIPLLAEHIPALALRSYLSSVMLGKAEFLNIPYDYFVDQKNRQVAGSIQEDAEKIAFGESLLNYKKYLQDENALTQLLTLLPCISIEGKSISIFDLADKISKNPNSVDIAQLPQSMQCKIKDVGFQKSQETQDQKKAEQEYGVKDTMVMRDTDLPNDPEIQKTASAYYAYDQLVRFIFEHTAASDVRPAYYLQVGQSNAHVLQGKNSIGFNLYYLEGQMSQLAEIIDQKLPATDTKVQRFFEEMIGLCTHERQHNLEGSEESQWTHNDVFFEGQRKVIAIFIKEQSINIQEVLNEIYRKYTSSFVPAKQLMKQMQ